MQIRALNWDQYRNGTLGRTVIALSILAFLAISGWLINTYQIPYRVYNSDIFHELAVLNEFQRTQNIQDPYFASGPADLHAGPYYYAIHIFTVVSGVSHYKSLLVITCLNIAFLQLALYFFGRSFGMTIRQCFILIVVSLIGWGSFSFFFAGIYEYANLLVSGAFPATFGIGLVLLSLGLAKRYFDTRQKPVLVLFIVMLTSLILSHLLSGVILLSFVALIVLEQIILKRSIPRTVLLVSGGVLLAILVTIFLWPPFSLLDLFTESKTVQTGSGNQTRENLFSIAHWVENLGFMIVGFAFVPKLIRDKRYFLAGLVVASAIMVISYMFPIRVTLYWRYFPFMFLGLSVAVAIWLSRLPSKIALVLVALVVSLGFVNFNTRLELLKAYPNSSVSEFAGIAKHLEKGSVVFTDPNTSYHLAALHDVRVVAVPYNHANPAYIPESKQRYNETIDFLFKSPTASEQRKFFNKYKVEYVLINPDYYPDYIRLMPDRSWLDRLKLKVPVDLIAQDKELKLYRLERMN